MDSSIERRRYIVSRLSLAELIPQKNRTKREPCQYIRDGCILPIIKTLLDTADIYTVDRMSNDKIYRKYKWIWLVEIYTF